MRYMQRNRPEGQNNRLSDRDIMLDILVMEKNLSHLYDHAINESSDPSISHGFQQLQHEAHENAREIFEVMQRQGWYAQNRHEQDSQRNGRRRFSNDWGRQHGSFQKMQNNGDRGRTDRSRMSYAPNERNRDPYHVQPNSYPDYQ